LEYHASCLFESDREIAFLANKFDCPVLSADSDFCVFSLKVGCIHPDDLLPALQQCTDNLPTKINNYQVLIKKEMIWFYPFDDTDMLSMSAFKSQWEWEKKVRYNSL
jgi:hypothetical protein